MIFSKNLQLIFQLTNKHKIKHKVETDQTLFNKSKAKTHYSR